MKKIFEVEIKTATAEKQIIQVEAIDEMDFRPIDASPVCACLMCQSNSVPTEIVSLEFSEEISETLVQFGFPADKNDHVALCGNCIEEFQM